MKARRTLLVSILALAPAFAFAAAPTALDVPVKVKKLANGLTVVVSENHESPAVGLCVLYKIGFRLEPRDRTGFAHLFEHLMFEGTPAAPKGVFDRVCDSSGGDNNGQTRPDETIYVERFPSSALDRFLYLEADRMKGLLLTAETLANQREVVKEEIRTNVKNDPYGLVEFSELPQKLFDKWENFHDGYGDFKDLDRASLDDARSFFATYYRPNNAVLAVAGDVSVTEIFDKVEKLFGGIAAGSVPKPPDLLEPKRTKPSLTVETAPLAQTPLLVAGWRTPPRGHPDAYPLYVLSALLQQGRASRFYRGLVEGREIATEVSGDFNPFQSAAFYEGTTLFLTKIGYRRGVPHAKVLSALEEEIDAIAKKGVPDAELSRVKTRLLASLYGGLENRLELATELAQATAFDGNAEGLLALPARIDAVTATDVERAAAWLSKDARVVIVKNPPAETPKGAHP